MVPPKRPPPPRDRRRAASCLVASAAASLASVLVIAAFFLPPINLPGRLLALQYAPLSAARPLDASPLRLSLPADAPETYALKITRLAPADFTAPPPAGLRRASDVFQLDAHGAPPRRLQIEFAIPASAPEPLALYGWDGETWRFLPAERVGSDLHGRADFAPRALALFQVLPAPPTVLLSQEISHDLDAELAGLATILSPAGLRVTAQGSLIGSLAPGGHADADYLFMPLARNFSDPRAIDRATVEAIIAHPGLRADHVNRLSALASHNRFDGMFIDYRGLSASHRADFSAFMAELAGSFAKRDLLLGVVAPATGEAYAWRALGEAVDFFQLRPLPHPLDYAPGDSSAFDALLRRATRLIPRGKLLVGLSARSFREAAGALLPIGWHQAFAPLGDVVLAADTISETGAIEPGTVVRASLSGYDARWGRDASIKTNWLDYLDDSDRPIARVWLTDAAALQFRLERLAADAAGGVAFDDLLEGAHHPGLPTVIDAYKAGDAKPAPPADIKARWLIAGEDGPLHEVESALKAELSLTLEAPDGNYAVNWSALAGDGVESSRRGAVLPLYRPTPTPSPTPTPTPIPRPVAAPRVSAPVRTNFSAAPPPPGSISIEIGGHVTGAGSQRAIHAMRQAGMNWMKIQKRFTWHSPPDVSGDIATSHSHGFKLLVGTVGHPDELASGGPEYIHAYTDWLARIASQGADAIEVWNEPNIDREWPRGRISGVDYARMLAEAYQKIKQVNGNTMVISAAPAPTGVSDNPEQVMPDNQWLLQMKQGGGLNYLDCVGAHYNEGIVPPGQNSGDPRGDDYYTRFFHGMLNGYISITRKPICFTELGYLTSEGLGNLPPYFSWASNVTLQQQATWLAQAAALASRSGQVRLLIVWNIDFTHYDNDPQAGYAIVRPNGACPACDALRGAR